MTPPRENQVYLLPNHIVVVDLVRDGDVFFRVLDRSPDPGLVAAKRMTLDVWHDAVRISGAVPTTGPFDLFKNMTRADLLLYARTHPGYLANAVTVLLRDLDAMDLARSEADAHIDRLVAERDDLRGRLAAAQRPRVDVAEDEAGRRITTVNGVVVRVDPARRPE